MFTYRLVFKAFILSASLVAASFYFQHEMSLTPCALCYLQRYLMMAVAAVLLVMLLLHPGNIGIKLFGLLTMLTAGLGAAVSGRHIWLQKLPAGQMPTSCSADLYYMIETLPFKKVLENIMSKSADCARVSWKFLGLTMPMWTFGFFILFVMLGFYLSFSRRR